MNETIFEARKLYDEYIEEGLSLNPPFKGFGIKFLQFANDKPEYFSEIFFSENYQKIEDFIEIEGHSDDIIQAIESSLHLTETQSKWFYKNIFQYTIGIASLIINKSMQFNIDEISTLLGNLCRSFLLSLHTPSDERINIMPSKNQKIDGSVASYSNIPFNKISGIGENNVYFQIDINSILYFEADGDLVFAYTKKEIYKVKQRLYQIERISKGNHFMKASKAFLINSMKIDSYRTSNNGRIYFRMQNGEEILASRMYSKEILNELKEI